MSISENFPQMHDWPDPPVPEWRRLSTQTNVHVHSGTVIDFHTFAKSDGSYDFTNLQLSGPSCEVSLLTDPTQLARLARLIDQYLAALAASGPRQAATDPVGIQMEATEEEA